MKIPLLLVWLPFRIFVERVLLTATVWFVIVEHCISRIADRIDVVGDDDFLHWVTGNTAT